MAKEKQEKNIMGRTFDFILAGAAIIVGIMLLTGHGDIFMKGGNTQLRKAKYDEKKMTKGSGVLVIILAGLMLYLKYKCTKN